MKSQLGVTMIELVIVLIITLVIATVAISSGKDTLTEADVTEVYVEMSTMQKTVNSVMLQREMNPNLEIEKDIPLKFWKSNSRLYSGTISTLLPAQLENIKIITANKNSEQSLFISNSPHRFFL